jgi:hypothetical protein
MGNGGMRHKRVSHYSLTRTILTLVVSGCIGGQGSGLVGIAGDDGGGANTGAAPVLSFFVQPGTANAGQIMSAIQVAASDSLGGVAANFTGVITVALASNSTGAGLSGTRSARASDGIATFSNLSVDRAGTYTLSASANGATSVTSSAFLITTPTTP